MIKLFFYGKDHTTAGKRFIDIVDAFQFEVETALFSTIESLITKLRDEINQDIIIVFLCADEIDFEQVYSHRVFLNDFRLILILPDLKDDTITKAFECYPRFVTYIDSDFSDVVSVLKKMVKIKVFDLNE